ncbi:MAG: glycosyltransferase [Bdellovibrionales bacterium]
MHVLHVITDLRTGGTERMLERVCLGLRELGVTSSVLSLRTLGSIGQSLRAGGLEVETLDLPSLGFVFKLSKVWSFFQRADIIQGWLYHGNTAATLGALLLRKQTPHVWNIRGSLDSYATAGMTSRALMYGDQWLSRWPQKIIYNSQRARREHEAWGYETSRGVWIPNGFTIPELGTKTQREWRRELGLPEDAYLVLAVGRLHPDKDYPMFLRALERLPALNRPVVGVCVGRGLETLESRAHIRFIAEVSDLSPYYQSADMFALSSRTEAFPNVLGEAMAYSLPCVSTDVGDVSDLMGQRDWISPVGRDKEFSRLIHNVLSLSPDQRAALGAANRRRIEERFGISQILREYLRLYDELVVSCVG